MILLDNYKFTESGITPLPNVATIGFFDGLHLGHRYMLEHLISISNEKGLRNMVVTFSNHPRLLFSPNCDLKLLSTYDEKVELIEGCGVDYCLTLGFTHDMARFTSHDFLRLLAEKFHVKLLLVGYDHRFGCDLQSGFEDYRRYGVQLGIEVIQMRPLEKEDVTISSSKIRKLLYCGDVRTANLVLGYEYSMTGKVVDGAKIGRMIGFPTANLEISPLKLIPKQGVYAVRIFVDGKMHIGMLNIGVRPTVNGSDVSIEVHIIDYHSDIYGKKIKISFVQFIREEHKFDTLDTLKRQLEKDRDTVIEIFGGK
jgi:riboflavin kinase/FMN adenylyltransferase